MKPRTFRLSTFEIGYLIIVVSKIIKITTANVYSISVFMGLIGYLAIISSIVKKRYSVKQFCFICIALLVVAYSYYVSKDDLLFSITVIGLSIKRIDFKKLIFCDLMVRIPLVVLIMVLAKGGVLQNLNYIISSVNKTSWGFSHPNHLGGMMFVIAIYYFYLRHKKFTLIDYSVLFLTFYVSYFIAGSRTSGYLIMGIIGFEFLDYIITKIPRIEKVKGVLLKISKYAVFFIPGISIWLSYNYKLTDPLMMGINNLLTGRLYLAYNAAKNNPVTLFGSYIEYKGGLNSTTAIELSNAIDNSYLYILLHLGVIVFALFMLALFVLLGYYMMNDRNAYICLIILMIGGFSESTMFDIAHNVFLLALIPAFVFALKNKKREKRRKEIVETFTRRSVMSSFNRN